MMIAFHLDHHSGVVSYLQLVQQVKPALRLGRLSVGDQLPTVREVVAQITINPNTVLKAYRELEREGWLRADPARERLWCARWQARRSPATQRRSLARWLHSAYEAGLDSESVLALFLYTFQDIRKEHEETA